MHTPVRAVDDASARPAPSRVANRSTDGADVSFPAAQRDASGVRAIVTGIVERASTLRERLAAEDDAAPGERQGNGSRLIDAWCATAAKGDAEAFARRLAHDGLDVSSAERAVGPIHIASGDPLPEWAVILERYITALGDSCGQRESGVEQIPFIEIVAPLADIAERELHATVSDALDGVSTEARRGLRAVLLQRLARVSAPILYEFFEEHRSERVARRSSDTTGDTAAPDPPGAICRDFVQRLLAGGMLQLLHELPALARAMTTAAILWRDASAELLTRLHTDRDAISEHFADGRAVGELVTVDAGRSDPHSGGRTVHLLGFASGLRLVYKPRCLGVESAFLQLLDWLALRGAPVPPPHAPTFAARVLDRGSHGWAQLVEHRECPDRAAVRRYHQYAGSLLALLHALGSTDVHYENIVASGDRPVVVDLETVLQPEIARADPPRDRARNIGARRLYDDSVLRTGMLPAWQSAGSDRAYDIGGLSASDDQPTPFTTLRWSAVNSDAMRLERRRATTGAHPNLPRLAGRPIPPGDYVSDIVLGFARMYEWLAAHSEEILAPGGPLSRLAREEVRFIARPSSVYDHVLRRSLRRAALHDGAARSIELELLARGLLPLSPDIWPLLEAEERALEQLDIPVFTIRGDATEIVLGNHRVPVARSGREVARERLEGFDASDLEQQLRIVRASFALRYPPPSCARHAHAPPARRDHTELLPRAEIIAAAMEIASEIGRSALTDCTGNVTWISTEPVSTAGHQRLQATGYGLYDGLAGIALFLAAASRCGGDSGIARLARRALAPIRWRLRSSQSYAEEFGIGGAVGSASVAYALTRVGVLLGDDSIVDDALLAARQITPAAIAHDITFDVLYGSAGAVLALLALHRVRRCDWILETAVRCGQRLLEARRELVAPCGTAHQGWSTVDGMAHVGMAHGSSGIALALLRLHAATRITEYASAAMDALRWEDSRIRRDHRVAESEAAGAPTTVSPGTAMSIPTNWCRGSAGIGLARLTSAAGAHSPELRAGAQRAVVHVRARGATDRSTEDACCGTSGEIELLLTAGLRWGDSALLASAHARASDMLRRARSAGRHHLAASAGADFHDPTLYRGMAGIGYGLLRLCHPELLPSFLSWE